MEEQGIIAQSDGTNRPRVVLVGSMDEGFGASVAAGGADEGDVYDDETRS